MKLSPRIRKEARALFRPWCVVLALMAGTMLVWREAVFGLLIYWLGGAFLSAVSFGEEFQSRTLPMLLAQPISRTRLWLEKMLVLVAFLVILMAAFHLCYMGVGQLWGDIEFWGAHKGVVAVACAAAYWTLTTRSTLGGAAFAPAHFYLTLLALIAIDDVVPIWTVLVRENLWKGVLVYALVFLWQGLRKFSRLELNAYDGGEAGLAAPAKAGLPGLSFLRPRAGSPLLNLLRKELRLQLPVLLLALLFTACGLLLASFPSRYEVTRILLSLLGWMHPVVVLVLAGCLPLAEERALGLHQANLMLPVSVRWQWLLKLGIGLAVGLVAGVGLPLLLALSVGPRPDGVVGLYDLAQMVDDLSRTTESGMRTLVLGAALLVLLGLWSAAMMRRATNAVLLALLVMAMLVPTLYFGGTAGIALAPYLAEAGIRPDALVRLGEWWVAHYQIPLSKLKDGWQPVATAWFFAWPGALTLVLVAGVQAWLAFGRYSDQAKFRLRSVVRIFAACGLMAAAGGLAYGLMRSVPKIDLAQSLDEEAEAAFSALVRDPSRQFPPSDRVFVVPVSLAELEATGKLSAATKKWLRGSSLSLRHTLPWEDGGPWSNWRGRIDFPHGGRDTLSLRESEAFVLLRAIEAFWKSQTPAMPRTMEVTVDQLETTGKLNDDVRLWLAKKQATIRVEWRTEQQGTLHVSYRDYHPGQTISSSGGGFGLPLPLPPWYSRVR